MAMAISKSKAIATQTMMERVKAMLKLLVMAIC
jgi:hypothetical protein